MPTVAFTTLGCKVNQYETQRILERFEAAGFAVTAFGARADVYVVNTCSVTGVAEGKSRYAVRRARRLNPDAKVVVTGCAAQMALNAGAALRHADLLVPNPEKMQTVERLFQAFPEIQDQVAREPAPIGHKAPAGRTRATLKVQDGCDVMCSYCSIPYTRPGLRSRPYSEVLAEAKRLVEQGYVEAVLTGVLIGAYGPETGSGGPSFEDLVEGLAAESGLTRLRISSIEMHQVTDRIVALARQGVVAPHFHIPLQSGSNAVLRAMNRRYDSSEFIALCDRLTAEVPDLSLTTDVMVGFPTETEEDFEASMAVCRHVGFLKAHVFRFSSRPGTPADQWGDSVPDAVKQDRSHRLMELSEANRRTCVRRYLGRTMRVLVEGKQKDGGLLEGLTDNYVVTRFAGPLSLARTLRWVKLGDERDGVAYGEVVPGPEEGGLRVLS